MFEYMITVHPKINIRVCIWRFHDLSAESIYKTSAGFRCHNPAYFVIFQHLKSSKCFGKIPKRLSTRKGTVLISMYDQTVTFQGDIFVTFCPNGATETANMVCIRYFLQCVCVYEVQMLVSLSLKVMLSLFQMQILQYESKCSS